MPSADFRYAFGKPYGVPSPSGDGRLPDLPGSSLLFSMHSRRIYGMRLVTGGLRIVLHPRPTHHASYPPIRSSVPICAVRSARIFASGFLSAPLAGIQLPSATLRRYLTGTGLARLLSSNFPLGLTLCGMLVRSRSAPANSRACPAHNQSVERDFGLAAPLRSAANPKRLTLAVLL